MWDKFLYFGLRATLVDFLIEPVDSNNPGFDMAKNNAILFYELWMKQSLNTNHQKLKI